MPRGPLFTPRTVRCPCGREFEAVSRRVARCPECRAARRRELAKERRRRQLARERQERRGKAVTKVLHRVLDRFARRERAACGEVEVTHHGLAIRLLAKS